MHLKITNWHPYDPWCETDTVGTLILASCSALAGLVNPDATLCWWRVGRLYPIHIRLMNLEVSLPRSSSCSPSWRSSDFEFLPDSDASCTPVEARASSGSGFSCRFLSLWMRSDYYIGFLLELQICRRSVGYCWSDVVSRHDLCQQRIKHKYSC